MSACEQRVWSDDRQECEQSKSHHHNVEPRNSFSARNQIDDGRDQPQHELVRADSSEDSEYWVDVCQTETDKALSPFPTLWFAKIPAGGKLAAVTLLRRRFW